MIFPCSWHLVWTCSIGWCHRVGSIACRSYTNRICTLWYSVYLDGPSIQCSCDLFWSNNRGPGWSQGLNQLTVCTQWIEMFICAYIQFEPEKKRKRHFLWQIKTTKRTTKRFSVQHATGIWLIICTRRNDPLIVNIHLLFITLQGHVMKPGMLQYLIHRNPLVNVSLQHLL